MLFSSFNIVIAFYFQFILIFVLKLFRALHPLPCINYELIFCFAPLFLSKWFKTFVRCLERVLCHHLNSLQWYKMKSKFLYFLMKSIQYLHSFFQLPFYNKQDPVQPQCFHLILIFIATRISKIYFLVFWWVFHGLNLRHLF